MRSEFKELAASANFMLKMPDSVRQTIIISLWVMHWIIVVLTLAVIFGRYDEPTLDIIRGMFSTTLTAIGAGLFTLVGDRGVKNVTAPKQEDGDVRT